MYFQLLAQARRAIRAKESVLKDKIQFLANESGNNVEYEKRIAIADRQATKLRLDYQKEEGNRNQLQDEVILTLLQQISKQAYEGRFEYLEVYLNFEYSAYV